MKFTLLLLCVLLLASCQNAPKNEQNASVAPTENKPQKEAPNNDALRQKIAQILAAKQATVGISIIANDGKDTISFNGDRHFPMQSVFKFHIALAILAEVDKGKLAINQLVEVPKFKLFPKGIWSPLRDENPEGGKFTIEKLIQYSVSQSDNTACDVLIDLLGSPKSVEDFFKTKGIQDIQIRFNERDMQSKWENMYENWTTPKAASETIKMFYENNLLSKSSHEFFWKVNKETITGGNRLRKLLPPNTVVAHKTGTSGTHQKTGITAAVNDIGIVFLPNDRYFIISVFVSESKENEEANEQIIADVAKAAYDFYSAK